MRELNDEEVLLVSGGTQSNPWRVVVWDHWGKMLYKEYWYDAYDNSKNVAAGDAAAYAWLDAAWEAENNPPPATDPVPAPAPAPQPSAPPIMGSGSGGGGGGGGTWDHHVHLV